MISLLIGLIIFALICYMLWWVLNQIPMAQPIRVIVTVLFVTRSVQELVTFGTTTIRTSGVGVAAIAVFLPI